MLKSAGLTARCWISLAMLSALLLSSSGCQYSGSFEDMRCSKASDCPGTSQCVEGYCLAEPDRADVSNPAIASVSLTPESVELAEGETTELMISVLDKQGTVVANAELRWQSTDAAVATVDENGVITAHAAGIAVVTASANGTLDSTQVTVTPVAATSIAIEPSSLQLKPGERANLSARVLDEDGQELDAREVQWSSEHPDVAYVDASGQVTAIEPGTTTLTAKSGDAEQSVTVDVLEADLVAIDLTPSSATLMKGDDFALSAVVRDEFGEVVENAPVTWTSSDDAVASVDDGVVSALAEGSATITAQSGTAQATADITVEPVAVASIELSPTSATLETGATVALDAQPLAADGSMLAWPTITYSSSNDAVASVDATGTVTAHQPGAAAITATAGGVEKAAAIAVTSPQAAGLSISPNHADIEVGLSVDLNASVQDLNGNTIANPFVIWESSDTTVALVDATGEVYGVDVGSATITARTENGTQATATVDVAERAADTIDLRPQSATIEETQTLALDATVRASDQRILEGRTITYSSSNATVVSVDTNGVVTGLAPGGPVTITATSGNATQTVDITVEPRSVAVVEVSPSLESIDVQQDATFSASARAADGSALIGRAVTWSSDDATIASVDANGVVTGQSPGVTLIRATVDGKEGFASVNVAPRPVATVEIVEGDQTIAKGASFGFSATTRDSGGAMLSGRVVSWSSDDTSVAVVDSSGRVTGVSGGQATITATSEMVSDTVSVSVTANAAPTATAQTLATDEDTPLAITLTGDDPDNDPLTFSIAALPNHGTLSALDSDTGAVTYTPNADFNGSDSFTFGVSDPSGATASASVSLTVRAINDAPFAADDQASTTEETSATVDVLANDSDIEGDALSVTIDVSPVHGTAVVNADETITYTPGTDFNGDDSFSYLVSDGNRTDSATVQVSVAAANDLPVANDDAAATDEDHSVTFDVLANDSDVDGDALAVSSTTSPGHGAVTINGDGTLTYTPGADFNGSDAFFYEISDGNESATARVDITITAVNDAPVAVSDGATVAEDGSVDIDVVTNDTDVDADLLSVASIDLAPAHGVAVANGDGTITYTPDADFHGADVFIYTVSDGAGGLDTTYVELTVTSESDAPVADAGADQTVNQNDTVQLDGSASFDADGDSLTYAWSVISEPAGSSITLDDADTATPSFVATEPGTYELELTVDDGTQTHSDNVIITSE